MAPAARGFWWPPAPAVVPFPTGCAEGSCLPFTPSQNPIFIPQSARIRTGGLAPEALRAISKLRSPHEELAKLGCKIPGQINAKRPRGIGATALILPPHQFLPPNPGAPPNPTFPRLRRGSTDARSAAAAPRRL